MTLHRINECIDTPLVRVVTQSGELLSAMPIRAALERAMQAGLDLVEVGAEAQPPICRIMDYGAFKREQAKTNKWPWRTRRGDSDSEER